MNNPDYERALSIYEFTVRNIKGEKVKLALDKGHVCIVVNVASQCKLAAINYKQLNDLYEEYERKGLRILAFPCNQFNGLEPGDSEQIASFAADHHVKFDMFEKIDVNGGTAHPLWKFLKPKDVQQSPKLATQTSAMLLVSTGFPRSTMRFHLVGGLPIVRLPARGHHQFYEKTCAPPNRNEILQKIYSNRIDGGAR